MLPSNTNRIIKEGQHAIMAGDENKHIKFPSDYDFHYVGQDVYFNSA